jgi:hypothetical protein
MNSHGMNLMSSNMNDSEVQRAWPLPSNTLPISTFMFFEVLVIRSQDFKKGYLSGESSRKVRGNGERDNI